MSIMVRADITEDEWKSLRKLAIDLGVPIQQLVASALRARLAWHDAKPDTSEGGK